MNKKASLFALAGLVGTSFIAGQIFAPVAQPKANAGTSGDPVITRDYFNNNTAQMKNEISSLKTQVADLKKKVDSLSSGSGSGSGSGESSKKYGTTTASTLNIRSGAGTNYSVVDKVSKNTKVEILESKTGWYKVKLPNNKVGWGSKDYIKV